MKSELAKNYYTGKIGTRVNCAQAVALAFNETGLSSEMALCGGGNAPGGHCGAYHSAAMILSKYKPEMLPELEKHFINQAKFLKCSDIRGNRSLSCVECVREAASFVETALERETAPV